MVCFKRSSQEPHSWRLSSGTCVPWIWNAAHQHSIHMTGWPDDGETESELLTTSERSRSKAGRRKCLQRGCPALERDDLRDQSRHTPTCYRHPSGLTQRHRLWARWLSEELLFTVSILEWKHPTEFYHNCVVCGEACGQGRLLRCQPIYGKQASRIKQHNGGGGLRAGGVGKREAGQKATVHRRKTEVRKASPPVSYSH